MRKNGIAFYGKLCSFLLALAGLVCFILSNTLSPANRMASFPALCGLSVLGLLFGCLSLILGKKGGKAGICALLSSILAVLLYTLVLGRQVNGRVLLISGLFTWNSMNLEGWRVFYFMVASAAGFLLSDLVLIVSSFFRIEGED